MFFPTGCGPVTMQPVDQLLPSAPEGGRAVPPGDAPADLLFLDEGVCKLSPGIFNSSIITLHPVLEWLSHIRFILKSLLFLMFFQVSGSGQAGSQTAGALRISGKEEEKQREG